jgi:hypothetical protein
MLSATRRPSMRHLAVAVLVLVLTVPLAVLSPHRAIAGPYSDELAKCLVRSTTDSDKNYLVKWMFASAALHPEVKSIAAITDAQRDELNRNAARLFERLITDSCLTETQEALRFEGRVTIQSSFQVLGQVAARGLFSDPAVAKSMTDFSNYLDKQKLEKVFGPGQ